MTAPMPLTTPGKVAPKTPTERTPTDRQRLLTRAVLVAVGLAVLVSAALLAWNHFLR